jgi:hypothetical protein
MGEATISATSCAADVAASPLPPPPLLPLLRLSSSGFELSVVVTGARSPGGRCVHARGMR